MSTISNEKERHDWIESLKIPEEALLRIKARQQRFNVEDKEDSADVVGGSVACFVTGLPKQAREDVQNSTLLMQLAADAQFNPRTEREDWFNFYTSGLANLGWGRFSDVYQKYNPKNTNATISQIILEIIGAIISPTSEAYLLTKRTFDSMENDPKNKDAVDLFSMTSTVGQTGTFQILPTLQDRDGNTIMLLTSVDATTTEQHGCFLFWKWSTKNSVMFRAAQQSVLNEQVYAQVRSAVLKKLGKNADDFINGLVLKKK
ncbi:hypothetical protein DUD43_09485 [Alcaligenes faecalis]|uniref:hypothetical protein n=1 Tax=Alcaligenes TaxID=507 RepID=UPI0012932101|nr:MULTISPECIES: hypothetical protein [Alcaligenes]MBX6964034.1 hypothetical protein [Providencia rettgeri]MBX7029589.1 hypothetical protein [Alcaligenes faecalis]QFY77899.1 hypothetical protein DUD43_09485 [Alcaligenes faecalis]QTC00589.1 hypothetical protein JYG33_03735 [Alcaligenes sp. SORT26]